MQNAAKKTLSFNMAWIALLCFITPGRSAERPEYCAAISDDLLGGLAAPYAKQTAPDGSLYCEGLLRTPISLPPPEVISVKQDQGDTSFVHGSNAVLTWCDETQLPTHIQLRSIKQPLFALDALQARKFEWRADLIATWQPDWSLIAALATRQASIEGHNEQVVIPVRMGLGYSAQYSFVVHSKALAHFTVALIEPLDAAAKPEIVSIVAHSGPTKDTWVVPIPFADRTKGVFRITFEEGIDQAGVSTKPIYLLHDGCTSK
jgi:hypothetical protein